LKLETLSHVSFAGEVSAMKPSKHRALKPKVEKKAREKRSPKNCPRDETGKKVIICHNSGNKFETISISEKNAKKHFKKHKEDYCGECIICGVLGGPQCPEPFAGFFESVIARGTLNVPGNTEDIFAQWLKSSFWEMLSIEDMLKDLPNSFIAISTEDDGTSTGEDMSSMLLKEYMKYLLSGNGFSSDDLLALQETFVHIRRHQLAEQSRRQLQEVLAIDCKGALMDHAIEALVLCMKAIGIEIKVASKVVGPLVERNAETFKSAVMARFFQHSFNGINEQFILSVFVEFLSRFTWSDVEEVVRQEFTGEDIPRTLLQLAVHFMVLFISKGQSAVTALRSSMPTMMDIFKQDFDFFSDACLGGKIVQDCNSLPTTFSDLTTVTMDVNSGPKSHIMSYRMLDRDSFVEVFYEGNNIYSAYGVPGSQASQLVPLSLGPGDGKVVVARLKGLENYSIQCDTPPSTTDPTFQSIREAILSKGYTFFDGPYNLNLVGVRSLTRTVGAYDDKFYILYEDTDGKEVIDIITEFTTDPGPYYMKNPLKVQGCAIVAPGQYNGVWKRGLHKGYNALTQTGGAISVFRDNNKDDQMDLVGSSIETGFYGINLHHGFGYPQVGKWSAGCQVFRKEADLLRVLALAARQIDSLGVDSFSYTLLHEEDLDGCNSKDDCPNAWEDCVDSKCICKIGMGGAQCCKDEDCTGVNPKCNKDHQCEAEGQECYVDGNVGNCVDLDDAAGCNFAAHSDRCTDTQTCCIPEVRCHVDWGSGNEGHCIVSSDSCAEIIVPGWDCDIYGAKCCSHYEKDPVGCYFEDCAGIFESISETGELLQSTVFSPLPGVSQYLYGSEVSQFIPFVEDPGPRYEWLDEEGQPIGTFRNEMSFVDWGGVNIYMKSNEGGDTFTLSAEASSGDYGVQTTFDLPFGSFQTCYRGLSLSDKWPSVHFSTNQMHSFCFYSGLNGDACVCGQIQIFLVNVFRFLDINKAHQVCAVKWVQDQMEEQLLKFFSCKFDGLPEDCDTPTYDLIAAATKFISDGETLDQHRALYELQWILREQFQLIWRQFIRYWRQLDPCGEIPCGDKGQDCCSESSPDECKQGLSCQEGSCQPCGALNQACCDNGLCNGGLTCRDGACRSSSTIPNPSEPPRPYVSRAMWKASGWNANPASTISCQKIIMNPNRFTIHHTGSTQSVLEYQKYHQSNRLKNNVCCLCDIGYHFLISKDGTIYQGRPFADDAEFIGGARAVDWPSSFELIEGSHIGDWNSDNIGISLIGCFDPDPKKCSASKYTKIARNDEQYKSLVRLMVFLARRFNIPVGASETVMVRDGVRNTVLGHKDYQSSACPGSDVYSLLPALREDVAAGNVFDPFLQRVMIYLDIIKNPFQDCALGFLESVADAGDYRQFVCGYLNKAADCSDSLDLVSASQMYKSNNHNQNAALDRLQTSISEADWAQFVEYWRSVDVCPRDTYSSVHLDLNDVMIYLDVDKYPFQKSACDYLESTIDPTTYAQFTCMYKNMPALNGCGDNLKLVDAQAVHNPALTYQSDALDYLQNALKEASLSQWFQFIFYWRSWDHPWLKSLQECAADRTYCAWGKFGSPPQVNDPVEKSYEEAKSSYAYLLGQTWLLDRMKVMSSEFDIPLAFLLSLGSRESGLGNGLGANAPRGPCPEGWGDRQSSGTCNGYGLFQMDKNYWMPEISESESSTVQPDYGPFGYIHMRHALKYFKECYERISDYHSDGKNLHPDDAAAGLSWTQPFILKGTAICYHSGFNGFKNNPIVQMDRVSTDYGSDFMTRAYWFYENAM
jgi:N-acetylmuramoyl-L-alanine amidase